MKSVRVLKAQLDKVFSEYIRKRDGKCIICDSQDNLQAGHFMSRRFNATRFSETNVHGECVRCNCFDPNSILEYRRKIIEKYGEGYDEYLEEKSHERKTFTVEELTGLISLYQGKIQEMS